MALDIREGEPMAPHTTFGVESVAAYYCNVTSLGELKEALSFANENDINPIIMAGGSNLVCAPSVNALVIHINLKGLEVAGNAITVSAGESLMHLVESANEHGLKGLESLAGIPGTVGGAIVGNAGAYGTEIGSRVTSVSVFDGKNVKEYSRDDCIFAYRNSVFKDNRSLIVLSAAITLEEGSADELTQFSKEIVEKREAKYPPGLRCPGSFFKNQLADEVSSDILSNLPERAVVHGKVAVGYLIEAVGGRGMCVGDACVADYHGNLLINTGNATYEEVRELAEKLRTKVREHFGVELEEEIRYIA